VIKLNKQKSHDELQMPGKFKQTAAAGLLFVSSLNMNGCLYHLDKAHKEQELQGKAAVEQAMIKGQFKFVDTIKKGVKGSIYKYGPESTCNYTAIVDNNITENAEIEASTEVLRLTNLCRSEHNLPKLDKTQKINIQKE